MKTVQQALADIVKVDDLFRATEGDSFAGHTEDHTGCFALRQRKRTGLPQMQQTTRAIGAHAGQERGAGMFAGLTGH